MGKLGEPKARRRSLSSPLRKQSGWRFASLVSYLPAISASLRGSNKELPCPHLFPIFSMVGFFSVPSSVSTESPQISSAWSEFYGRTLCFPRY